MSAALNFPPLYTAMCLRASAGMQKKAAGQQARVLRLGNRPRNLCSPLVSRLVRERAARNSSGGGVPDNVVLMLSINFGRNLISLGRGPFYAGRLIEFCSLPPLR